jgi:hypothetical protein
VSKSGKIISAGLLPTLLLFSAVFSLQPSLARAELTGRALLENCSSKLMLPQGLCNAYLEGLMQGHFLTTAGGKAFYCLPVDTSFDRAKKVAVRYLKKNAALLDRDAGALILQALAEEYPCQR